MTEKFDGIRVLWNGTRFFTRKGNSIKCPDFILNMMPPFALDGEFWYKLFIFY